MARRATNFLLALSLTLAAGGAPSAVAAEPEPTPAQATFDRLKALAGSWNMQSTKGWTATGSTRVIAEGTAILSTSFDAHPGETMATLYHMDGDRLMLTHYCVSGTQPRLVATDFSADGNVVTFTFLDGTGMASRDRGHMDKVVYRFGDDNTYSSQWTWYQNGTETWLEEISATRVADSTP